MSPKKLPAHLSVIVVVLPLVKDQPPHALVQEDVVRRQVRQRQLELVRLGYVDLPNAFPQHRHALPTPPVQIHREHLPGFGFGVVVVSIGVLMVSVGGEDWSLVQVGIIMRAENAPSRSSSTKTLF